MEGRRERRRAASVRLPAAAVRLPRPPAAACLAALLALLVPLGPAATAPAAGPGPAAAGALVSLGDSFISGEGGRWLGNGVGRFGDRSGTDRAAVGCDWAGCDYDPVRVYGPSEDNDCHRSDTAPVRSAPAGTRPRLNLACSGARLVNLLPAAAGGLGHFGEPPQLDRLARYARRVPVQLVLVTAGANDVGFGGLVADCALAWARSDVADPALCRDRSQAAMEARLGAMQRLLRGVLLAARAALEGGRRRAEGDSPGAGRAPRRYRLVVASYASPFPPGRWIRYPEDGWSRLREGGCPLWNADADWAAGPAVGSLAATMRSAAAASGAEFLDLRGAFDGHQLCDRRSRRVGAGGPSPLSAEWVRRLAFLQGSSRESLHPNAFGQRAIGVCIGLLLAVPPGDYACRDSPGLFLDGMRLEPLG